MSPAQMRRGGACAPAQEGVLNFDVAVLSREIVLPDPDPVDRFLVATASVYGLTLVTADESLICAKLCSVLPKR